MNLIGTPGELQKTADYLKREFEMKDLGKTKYSLGLQIEHSANGILVHQSTYTEKVLKRFGMDKAHPLSTPMVVRSLDTKKDPYHPKGDDEMILDPEQGTALLQQGDIGPASNMFYDTFVGQQTWAYSIPMNQPMPRVLLDMLMQDTSLIHIKGAHKPGMYSHVEEL
ncbi:unnamed protein product [Prunus brigantina]